jgi:hypothetical protein
LNFSRLPSKTLTNLKYENHPDRPHEEFLANAFHGLVEDVENFFLEFFVVVLETGKDRDY